MIESGNGRGSGQVARWVLLFGLLLAVTAVGATAATAAPSAARSGVAEDTVAKRRVPASRVEGGDVASSDPVTQDALWTWSGAGSALFQDGIYNGVCTNPTETCSVPAWTANIQEFGFPSMTTDGVNMYLIAEQGGVDGPQWSWSCPLAGYGTGCTAIFTGRHYQDDGYWWTNFSSAAAVDAEGAIGPAGKTYIFIGVYSRNSEDWNGILRCPSDVAPSDADYASTCVTVDWSGAQRGGHMPYSMVVANGYLWVGLRSYNLKFGSPLSGLVWRCQLWKTNSCTVWDDPGDNAPVRDGLEVGGGYLWVALGPDHSSKPGIIWRCDMSVANGCTVWDTTPTGIYKISYDGQGTLYVAVSGKSSSPGMVWSCPIATKNSCTKAPSTDLGGYVFSVEAGPAGAFAVSSNSDNGFGELTYGSQVLESWGGSTYKSQMMYVPVGGPRAPGAVNVDVPFVGATSKLETRCAKGGKVRAEVSVRGPFGMRMKRRVDLCSAREAGHDGLHFGALDPGSYSFAVRVGKHRWGGTAEVERGATTDIEVALGSKK